MPWMRLVLRLILSFFILMTKAAGDLIVSRWRPTWLMSAMSVPAFFFQKRVVVACQ